MIHDTEIKRMEVQMELAAEKGNFIVASKIQRSIIRIKELRNEVRLRGNYLSHYRRCQGRTANDECRKKESLRGIFLKQKEYIHSTFDVGRSMLIWPQKGAKSAK